MSVFMMATVFPFNLENAEIYGQAKEDFFLVHLFLI